MTKSRMQFHSSLSIAILAESDDDRSPFQTMTYSLLSRIPPERVGLNGEYDHGGLAKRVLQAFQTKFSIGELKNVRVTQRGKVVVLLGKVANSCILNQLISIALRVEGATGVETTGIKLK